MVVATSDPPNRCDFDLGGLHLASFVFIAIHDPPTRGPHVNHCLPFLPSWLQLLATFLVVKYS